jgi:transcriptional regulator with XRE-family HTH domain
LKEGLSMDLRQIRETKGWPRIKVAVIAGVAESTVRQYEANPASVGKRVREALEPMYREMAEGVSVRALTDNPGAVAVRLFEASCGDPVMLAALVDRAEEIDPGVLATHDIRELLTSFVTRHGLSKAAEIISIRPEHVHQIIDGTTTVGFLGMAKSALSRLRAFDRAATEAVATSKKKGA